MTRNRKIKREKKEKKREREMWKKTQATAGLKVCGWVSMNNGCGEWEPAYAFRWLYVLPSQSGREENV